MRQRHIHRKFLFISLFITLVTGAVLWLGTPLSLGGGGPECGPDVLRLYRFVEDDIVVLHRDIYPVGQACRRHDHCYARPIFTRQGCDAELWNTLTTTCVTGPTSFSRSYCRVVAGSFYLSVRAFGWAAYDWDDLPQKAG